MNKIWKPTEPKSDKIILIREKIIYKGNPSFEVLQSINEQSFNIKEIKNLFGIPYSYIKKIENQKDKKFIKIYLGNDSEEQLNIVDERLKDEVFDFLKEELSHFQYKVNTPNLFSYTKPQFFGILLLTIVYIITIYFAVQLSNGYSYELQSSRVGGIIGILILLAENGYLKLTIWYSILLGLAIFTLMKKIKSRSEVQILKR